MKKPGNISPYAEACLVALSREGLGRHISIGGAVGLAGLSGPADCWNLWQKRQRLSGHDESPARARIAVLSHLNRIELNRPLESISDCGMKEEAQRVRSWFGKEFLDALPG